ncbi:MAG: DNA repair protein RecO [Planctomycetota bacterium]|jgi:DNA repair protein RecO (recombination protein O)
MPTVSDIAIVLRQWDFSETSQTVRLLTREHGPLRGLAKGARRERGMFSGGFEVGTRGQLVAITRPGRDLATLTEWRLLEVFPGVRRRLAANRVALLALDLVAHLLHDGDPHPEIFDTLLDMLRTLEEPGRETQALLRFQWRLLEETGYAPRLDDDADVLAFRPDAGGFTTDPASIAAPGAWRLRRSTLQRLRELPETAPDDRPESPDPHDRHDSQDPPDRADPHDADTRACRLLASYARHLAGRDLPSIAWAFGSSD